MSTRVLFVDDDESMRDVVATRLGARGYGITTASGGDEATARLAEREVDVVVTDLRMRGMAGTQLCSWVVENRPTTPVLVITAFGTLETAIAAMRAGAYDFLTKPLEIEALVIAVERAAQHRYLRDEVQRLRQVVERQSDAWELVGESAVMRGVHALVQRVATSAASVLITGESGTGKEVVARLLHRLGGRTGQFVAVNCAAVPEALLESELFGHVKGAFTDAKTSRDGLLVQSTGGTILLDEIGDMPLGLQPKLLRTLEDRKVRPVGATREVQFDARIIAATHRDLEAAVESSTFRSDLYFRLNVIQIELPPLRARGNDVLLLAQRFVEAFARQSGKPVTGLSSGAAQKLLAYAWPGNVRELRNCIERAVTLTQHSQLVVEDLPERIQASKQADILALDNDPTELLPMAEVEKRYIRRVMQLVGGNKALAARTLGFDRTTLYRKLQQYELDAEA